ncbi:long-chain fatty acid--CoA ligase [Pelagibacteraceae bacterium]|nr:long-chain fatty acid--CoA ligase [Pelagibacteraceae bacterium]
MEEKENVALDTVPKIFWNAVNTRKRKTAMREKDLGIWQSISWKEYGEKSKYIGLALNSLGLNKSDVVSIASEGIPEWLFTDLGVICVGGISSGVYTTDSSSQVEYLVNDSKTSFYFAENEEQLDKILEVRDNCPTLKKIIIYDLEGLHDFSDPQVISFSELVKLGEAIDKNHPDLFESLMSKVSPEDIAILVYTSGTTGPSKGAMISNNNIVYSINSGMNIFKPQENDEQLSFLPLCHILERTVSVMFPLQSAAVINFAESIDTVPENIREVSPTGFIAVPRIWEKFYSSITITMKDATFIGKAFYNFAISVGSKRKDYILNGEPVPFTTQLLFGFCDQLVLKNIKKLLGLNNCRYALSGAAPISPELIDWYLSIGLDMREGWGMTETAGIGTAFYSREIKKGCVGRAIDGSEVQIAKDGEILFRGPGVFCGYLNKPEQTNETIIDGWLHTGDVGHLDNSGNLKITDRKKDIIITAGGKNISPSEIENELKFSAFISDAVVIGDKRKFLSCLIMIDEENVMKFAQDHDVPFSNFESLCKSKEIIDLIEVEVNQVNKKFANVEQVKKFTLIDVQLTAEDDELTPTMKLKRKFINQKYTNIIEAMYKTA